MITTGIIVLLVTYAKLAFSENILGLFPAPSFSHQIVFTTVSAELARRGHRVTIITPNPVEDHKISDVNFTQIEVKDVSYKIWLESFNFAQIRAAHRTPAVVYPMFKDACIKILDAQLQTPAVKAIIENSNETFDLLLLESLVPATFGLSWKFKVPNIGISPQSGSLDNYDAIGNPTHSLFYPDFFQAKIGELNFLESIYAIYSDLWVRHVEYSFREKDDAIARKWFGEDAPPVRSLESNMDMLFLTVYPLLCGIRPVLPSIVYIGGVHMKPKEKLSKDLQTFLDESSQGVVYMSLGGNGMSKDLPPETSKMIVDVFKNLPYNVLWKYEEDLPNKPSNVFISKWFPQQEILGHPNLKVFITQGGQQSMEEAIRNHVPLIGIPFMADQDFNVQTIVHRGIGVALNINNIQKEEFFKAIMTVTKNFTYKANIRRLSKLLADQPMSGLERAVWWSEYVLRHGGARHLRAPTADVSLAEYFLLDVAAVLAVITTAITLVIAFLGRGFYKKFLQYSQSRELYGHQIVKQK